MSDNVADKHQKAAELDAVIKDGAKRKTDMEGNLDKLLSAMDGLTKGMRSFQTRLDALEARGAEPGAGKHLPIHDGHRGATTVPDDHGKVSEPGEPRSTVADSDDPNCAIFGRGGKQPLFWDRQSAADTACRAWGAAAVPPLHGEQLLDYRRRLLRPLMKHSKEFAAVDLDELREPLLTPIEKSVFADAIRASHDNSSVPEDYLREVTTTDHTGRRITCFYGQPRSWMNAFAGQRRRLIGIRTTSQP
jgi:hypothetical protein